MAEGVLQFNVASMVEDLLHQNEKRRIDIDLASRKAQEASLRRYKAAEWLRKMAGVVAGKDLPAEPSEEHFRLGLRSGILLCNVLNKIQPGAVPKVIEANPVSMTTIPDCAALTAYQYFENIRNFLVAIEQTGIPTFDASDLEQGGKSSKVVDCVLALKSYYEWKQCGVNGQWKFSGFSKPISVGKQIVKKNYSDFILNFISRNSVSSDSLPGDYNDEQLGVNDVGKASHLLHVFVRDLLSDKSREDIPVIVEHMLSNLMEEIECRLASQNKHASNVKTPDKKCSENITEDKKCSQEIMIMQEEKCSEDVLMPEEKHSEDEITQDEKCSENITMQEEMVPEEALQIIAPAGFTSEHRELVVNQQRSVQELKNLLHIAKQEMKMLRMNYQEEVDNLGKHMYTLAHAAAGYTRVLEENRKLYNQVQDLKGSIRVYCRVRPFLPGQASGSCAVDDVTEGSISIVTPAKVGKAIKSFNFSRCFGPLSSQEEVYEDTQPLIRSVLDGFNVCIFAYGQTGSGKTFTMTGPKVLTPETLGVNYRALGDLFEISEQRKNMIAYDISVQMMEIYNEQVRDLLATDGGNKRLEIRNNTSNGINVPNANLVPVKSTSDVINLMNLGHKNRTVGSTLMNDRSSRSHSCLTVHVQGKDLTSGAVLRGCMHLVDLAGSERLDKTEATGDRLKEAQHINRSLSALGDVISSLALKQSHVPYRNSKLTQLLQDSLGGKAKTLMFVHISPEPGAVGETLSTLKFAERVSTVELGAAKVNKDGSEVKELKEQIASLKAALARRDGGESVVQSYGSCPSQISWEDSLEDVSKTESTSRRHSLEPQDLLVSSPTWTEEEKGNNLGMSPEEFHQKGLDKNPGSRRHSLDNGTPRRDEGAGTECSDTTSDSSEADCRLQKISIPKSSSMPNVVGSKLSRGSPKSSKGPETRSLVPQATTTRRTVQSPLHRTGRQPASAIGRQPVSAIGRRKAITVAGK